MHGIQVLIFLHVVRWGMIVGMAGRAVLIAGSADGGGCQDGKQTEDGSETASAKIQNP